MDFQGGFTLESKDKLIQVLTDLGRTQSQARIYFALSRSGASTAKTISHISQVAREHVYAVLPQLQDLCLVEKIISVPSKFRALPIQEGLYLLLQCRATEAQGLQEQAIEIIRRCKNNNLEIAPREEDNQFILIPQKKAAINKRKKEIEAAQTSIDSLVSFTRLGPTANMYQEIAKEALERGVKIRLITEKPENKNEIPKSIQELKKFPSFKIRYIPNSPLFVATIYDRKEMLIVTSASKDLGESPAFWSNNPCFLAIVCDFYEIMWITALEQPWYSLNGATVRY